MGTVMTESNTSRVQPEAGQRHSGSHGGSVIVQTRQSQLFDAQVTGNSGILDGTTSNVGIRRATCLLDVLLIETVNFARQKWPCKTTTQESLLAYFVGLLPSKFDFPRA